MRQTHFKNVIMKKVLLPFHIKVIRFRLPTWSNFPLRRKNQGLKTAVDSLISLLVLLHFAPLLVHAQRHKCHNNSDVIWSDCPVYQSSDGLDDMLASFFFHCHAIYQYYLCDWLVDCDRCIEHPGLNSPCLLQSMLVLGLCFCLFCHGALVSYCHSLTHNPVFMAFCLGFALCYLSICASSLLIHFVKTSSKCIWVLPIYKISSIFVDFIIHKARNSAWIREINKFHLPIHKDCNFKPRCSPHE